MTGLSLCAGKVIPPRVLKSSSGDKADRLTISLLPCRQLDWFINWPFSHLVALYWSSGFLLNAMPPAQAETYVAPVNEAPLLQCVLKDKGLKIYNASSEVYVSDTLMLIHFLSTTRPKELTGSRRFFHCWFSTRFLLVKALIPTPQDVPANASFYDHHAVHK